jgi:hypothetical protein
MNRKLLIILGLILIFLASASSNTSLVINAALEAHQQSPIQAQKEEPLAITHGPYLQLPTSTSMVIVWQTNKKSVSKVEYGTNEKFGSTAISSH